MAFYNGTCNKTNVQFFDLNFDQDLTHIIATAAAHCDRLPFHEAIPIKLHSLYRITLRSIDPNIVEKRILIRFH